MGVQRGRSSPRYLRTVLIVTTRRFCNAACFLALSAVVSLLFLRHLDRPKAKVTQECADAATCVQCHVEEDAGDARSGMAHAFSEPDAEDTVDSPSHGRQFFHAASGTYFSRAEHDGRFYQRRWQQDSDDKPDNTPHHRVLSTRRPLSPHPFRSKQRCFVRIPDLS